MPTLSIIVPAYNEAESLPELSRQIRGALEAAGIDFEVWMVDDGSTDRSWKVIQEINGEDPRFAGIRFRKNEGKSEALNAGFRRSRGRYVATLDADLQDDPAELPAMVEKLEAGADMVSGWKRRRRDPINKTAPSRFFNLVTRGISGIPLHDFNSGIKAYRAEVVNNLRVYGEMHRYIPVLVGKEGYPRIEEQAVNHRPRLYGKTKFGWKRYLRGFLDLLTVIFLTRFARRPMVFFGGLGTLAFVLGFVFLAYLTVMKFAFGEPIGDRPLLLFGVMLMLLGAQSFLAGFLGEMIVRPEMEEAHHIEISQSLAPGISNVGERENVESEDVIARSEATKQSPEGQHSVGDRHAPYGRSR